MRKGKRIFDKDFIRALGFLRENSFRYFTGALAVSLMSALFSVVVAKETQRMVNAAMGKDGELFRRSLIELSASLAFLLIFSPLFSWWYNSSAKRTGKYIKMSAFGHMLTLPYLFFQNNHSGAIVSRLVNDSDNFVHLFGSRLRRFFSPILWALVTGVGLLFIEPKLGGILIGLNVLTMLVNVLFSAPVRRMSDAILRNMSSLTESTFNLFSGFLVIRLFNLQETALRQYGAANRKVAEESQRRMNLEGALDSVNYALRTAGTLGTVTACAFLLSRGLTDVGTLMALIGLQGQFSFSLLEAARNMPMLHASLSGACRIFSFLDEPPEKERDANLTLGEVESLELRNISFSYDGPREILRGISFQAGKGDVIALVGASGSGKTTLFKILAGLIDPTCGEVLYNGINGARIPRSALWDRVSYVSQQSVLFDDRVRENIRAGRLDATDGEIEQAARDAGAYDFIREMPDGFDTQVGERGIRLSGGQKQRIAIARSLVKGASLFLFDEATSSLDSRSEQHVQKSLGENSGQGIRIIIAHRLSTVQHADRIYVMRRGRIVGQGTHEELLKSNELYRVLNRTQIRET